MRIFVFTLITILGTFYPGRTQSNENSLIDSLYNVLATSRTDTNKINILNALSKHVGWAVGNYDTALYFANQAKQLSEQLNYKKGLGYAMNNFGAIYIAQGRYAEAMNHQFSSLKYFEEIGDKDGMSRPYNDIGTIYASQEDYPQALKYYSACLKASQEVGAKEGIGISYLNIGSIYLDLKNYQEAYHNFLAARKSYEEAGLSYGIAHSYSFIGEINFLERKYTEALDNFYNSLRLHEELDDKQSASYVYTQIGKTYNARGQANKGKEWLEKSLQLSQELGYFEGVKISLEGLSQADSILGDFKSALIHHKLYKVYHDSLINEENIKKITQAQLQYEFDKKESNTKAMVEAELKKQKLVRNSFIAGFGLVSFFALVILLQRNKTIKEKKRAEKEKQRSEELLLNILPEEVAEELKSTGTSKARTYELVTVMFTDFKDFTKVSEKITAQSLVDEINYCFSAFDRLLEKYHIEKIKTIGDSYMCVSGLPVSNNTHAVNMVNFALNIRDFMLERKMEKLSNGETPFELRIGIHSGPVVAGIVGLKKYAYDIWGDTVNIASRMEQHGDTGKINISESTYMLVKNHYTCEHRGKIQAKNKGELDMYYVEKLSNEL